jgi:hypothetical protein
VCGGERGASIHNTILERNPTFLCVDIDMGKVRGIMISFYPILYFI